MLVYKPTRYFSIVDCVHQVIGADDVSSSEHMRLRFILHSISINVDFALLVPNQHLNLALSVLRPEGTDYEVDLHIHLLSSELIFIVLH